MWDIQPCWTLVDMSMVHPFCKNSLSVSEEVKQTHVTAHRYHSWVLMQEREKRTHRNWYVNIHGGFTYRMQMAINQRKPFWYIHLMEC